LTAIASESIAPDLALYPLAGASQIETLDAALGSDELQTAYAELVFSLELTDSQRIGRLLQLARAFAGSEGLESASACYAMVYDLAVLSPDINDWGRAEALMASGEGWAEIGYGALALNAFDQAYLITVRSPYLHLAHRRELLQELVEAFEGLEQPEAADSSRERITELDEGRLAQTEAKTIPAVILPQGSEPISSEEVGALEETRRQAAFNVLQLYLDGNGPSDADFAELARALEAEDVAKMDLYRSELQSTTEPGRRIAVNWHMIRWLLVKYRVALQGFGAPLVPEWELRASGIRASLALSFQELYVEYEDLVTGMPQASVVEPGRYQIRREAMLAGLLGHYPDSPFPEMTTGLREAVTALIASGYVEPLFVDADQSQEPIRYFLRPSEEYGQIDED
jgi:hypothetical protein